MRFPKAVNVAVFYPSKKVLLVTAELRDGLDVLISVLEVLRKAKANVLGSSSFIPKGATSGSWNAFVEGDKLDATELKEKIGSLEGVVAVTTKESTNGLLVDSELFPLIWNGGDRMVMMRCRYLNATFEKMKETFGSGGDAIIFDEGFTFGNEAGKDFARALGKEFTRSHFRELLMVYQSVGWFRLEGVQPSKDGTIVLRATENFECEGAKSEKPHSHFVRGHLAGAASAITGGKMTCEETKCIASGDPVCEFTLRPANP